MPSSSSLILLPPRQTAQAPQNWSSSSRPASDDSFAPKLEKAKKAKTAASHAASTPVQKTAGAKSLAPKLAAADQDSKATGKSALADGKNPSKQNETAQDETAGEPDAQLTAKSPLPGAAAQTQAVIADEKKPVKVKTPVKSPTTQAAVRQHPAAEVQPAKQKPALSTATAAGTATSASTNLADADTDGDAADAADSTVHFGNGFYGSVNVVARGAGSGTAEDADAASGQADPSGAADSVATEAATNAPAAVVEAEIAAAPTDGKAAGSEDARPDTAAVLNALGASSAGSSTAAGKTTAAAAAPQASFAEENHPKIVDSIQGQLLPRGGTMQLQLHPAELGALQVTVQMKDGVMTASFQTTNDSATKMLSRSLGQLKSGLEAAGVSVEKLHVEQAPQDSKSNSDSGSKQPSEDQQDQQQQARQDQQRRELVKQMWKKLSGGDPLDLVA
jgi:hypothetical protein